MLRWITNNTYWRWYRRYRTEEGNFDRFHITGLGMTLSYMNDNLERIADALEERNRAQ